MTDQRSKTWFEPLGPMDRQFLVMEDENAHMHVSGFSLYEQAPLRSETGGVDLQTFRKAIESALDHIPRYRQKLAWSPIESRPVWVDDADFELDYHLRHISLPPPGSKDQLAQVVGWIVGQPLDRRRALWEMWIVEGVEDATLFAVVTKMHHCMVDGGSGVNLSQYLLRTRPDDSIREARPFTPRPGPGRGELAAWELGQRLGAPGRLLRGLRDFVSGSGDLGSAVMERAGAVAGLLRNALPASTTPISGAPLGPHRRVDWLEMPLDELATLRREIGCTLNDLVLAVVAGALRRYLQRRGVGLSDLDFRVSIPVNVRRESERERMGNRVSSWIIRMPLDEPDPRAQLTAIRETTDALKGSNQALGVEMLMAVADELPALLSLFAAASGGQISMVVTNVPGPPMPLYMLGCRAACMQPLVPLMPGVGIGVALLSYAGTLHWGFQADYDLVPDLSCFVEDVREAHLALRDER